MSRRSRTYEEFTVFLKEVKGTTPLLCCALHEAWKCAVCKVSLCRLHLYSEHFCKRCESWLINE